MPAENYFTVYGALGEGNLNWDYILFFLLTHNYYINVGFHNYHHTFPWDYAASELGWRFNVSTMFINAMHAIGLAYDLKQVSPEMIMKRKQRTGDVPLKGNYGLYHPSTTKIDELKSE